MTSAQTGAGFDRNGRCRTAVPAAGSGQCVGLFGGSFDPPHEGHRHVCVTALRRLDLAWIWWMVTPGNPLKDWRARAPQRDRLSETASFVRHPRFRVTGFEAAYNLRYSIDTIQFLMRRQHDIRFVWIMGGDSLRDMENWRDWPEIFESVPIAVVDRPGSGHAALRSKAAIRYADARVDEAGAGRLARMQPPAWTLLRGPLKDLSSTGIRNKTDCLEIDIL